MKIKICDLCKDRILSRDRSIIVKQHWWYSLFAVGGWGKLDICADCAKKLIKIAPNDTDKEFGKYPCNDYINNAIRLLLNNKNENAIEELLRAVKKADGNIFDDVKEKIKTKYTNFDRSLL